MELQFQIEENGVVAWEGGFSPRFYIAERRAASLNVLFNHGRTYERVTPSRMEIFQIKILTKDARQAYR